MMSAHVFTTLRASNSPHRRFCRSAVREGALPTPPREEYWRGKGKEIAKGLPSFLISLVSLTSRSPSPEMRPHSVTVTATAATDSPPDTTRLLPLQGS